MWSENDQTKREPAQEPAPALRLALGSYCGVNWISLSPLLRDFLAVTLNPARIMLPFLFSRHLAARSENQGAAILAIEGEKAQSGNFQRVQARFCSRRDQTRSSTVCGIRMM